MANDSTNTGTASVQDTTPTDDTYFTDMQGEADAFFGPEQLAQATTQTKVPAPQGENVIRVQVNPGEIIELNSPFDSGATLLAREGDGNLAIRVGDVTVILQGYVDANQAAPVVIETSDGQPIDIAILLASTDPAIDIQTAAGPGDAGQGGQGADNSGAFFGQLGLGAGLGGFNGVGAQDGTSLSYGLIDNSIRLDRDDALLIAGSTRFPGLSEPFLRDPFTNLPFANFAAFLSTYETYVNGPVPGNAQPGFADFEGTAAEGTDFESYLEQTSFSNQVPHASTSPEPMSLDLNQLQAIVENMSSNGHKLYVDSNSTGETAFVRRSGDDALILVIHAHAPGDLDDTTPANGTGGYQIDAFLINRLDHPDQGQDVLDLSIPYRIDHPVVPQEGSEEQPQEVPPTLGSVDVLIQDDIPIASPTEFANFLHSPDFKDALGCLFAVVNGQITDYEVTIGKGHVDEDYIFGGNRDKDNADGPDSDPVRGDDIGSKFLVGGLVIEWGADGPSGKVPPPTQVTLGDILSGPKCPALTVGLSKGDTFPGDVTSDGHTLKVLEKSTIIGGIEVLKVGYCDDGGYGDSAKGFGGQDVVVFSLYLQANPNAPLFGAFVFELCGPIDHDPEAGTIESNLALVIPIIATDDDGDHPLEDVNITVLVNDDAPMIKDVEYISHKGGIPCDDDSGPMFTGGGSNDTITSDQYGIVDEDWLRGGGHNDVLTITGVTPNEGGNHDKDGNGDNNAGDFGDDYGKTKVKGEINVSFGGDGPAESDPFTFSKSFETSGEPPLFTDADGTSYKSGGHDLVVLKSGPSGLIVGYIPESDPEAEYQPDPVVIFTMELNDSGCFEFCLQGPIDHAGADEQTLDIKFDVTVTDNDGDQAEVTLDIKVNDDKPEIGICYTSGLEAETDIGHLTGGGGNDVFHSDNYGRVDEDWLRGAVGNSVSYYGNQDKDGVGCDNPGEDGDKPGKTKVCGEIDIHYGGDGKNASDHGLGLFAYTVGDVFKDGDGTGNSFKSGDKDLVVLEVGENYVRVGIEGEESPPTDTESTERVVYNGDKTIFTFSFNESTGKFEFDLYGPIDHDPVDGKHGPETDQLITFDLGSVTDGDGDTAEAVVKIKVNDDHPEVGITYHNNLEHDFGAPPPGFASLSGGGGNSSTDYGRVDEDWLKATPSIINGSFEDPNVPGTFIPLPGGSGDLNGWTVGGDGVDHIGNYWNASDGDQSLDLSNLGAGSISRELTGLVVGQVYTVTFDLAGNPDGGPATVELKVQVGSTTDTYDFDTTGHDKANMGWESKSFTFTATNNTETLTFTSLTDTPYGPALDNLVLAAGPGYIGNQDKDGFGNDNAGEDGDRSGKTLVCGEINVNYGGDGPAAGDTGLALHSYVAGDIFKDGDGTGNSFKSGGDDLYVLKAGDDYVIVGTKDDEGGSKEIFEFHFDNDTGKFEFELWGPIDHHESGDGVESNVLVCFDVGSPTDGDGDTTNAVIKIKVNDDRPEVAITYHNETPGERVLTLVGPSDTVGKIDEDWLSNGNKDTDPAHPFSITNGSFETPVVLFDYATLNGPGGLDGWTIGGAGVDLINGLWQHADGDQSLDMSALGAGSISQTLTGLEVGRSYTVSFEISGNPAGPAIKELLVSAAGYNATHTFDSTSTNHTTMLWEQRSFTFTATSTTETLVFTSQTPGSAGPALDHVTIVANDFSNAGENGDDTGGTSLCGQITMNYGGDGPGSSSLGLGIYTDQTPEVDGDYPAFVNGNDKDGNPLPTPTSGHHELVVLESSATKLVVGYLVEPPSGDTVTVAVDALPKPVEVFTLTLNPETGKFEFHLCQPLDHPVAGTEDDLQLAFTAGSITDGDGDTETAVIRIDVDDDTPQAVGVEYVNNDGYYSTTVGTVDEDHLFSGAGNEDADGTPGDTDGKGAVFYDLTAGGYGADGPGSQPIGFTAAENDTLTVKDDNGDPHTLTTADGHTVLVHVDTSSSGFAVLYGYFNSDDSAGYVEGSSTKVFSLSFNQSSMDGQFNLDRSLEHPLAGTEDNLLLTFGIKTGLTDGDGDPAIATINIKVNDDGPVAVDDTFTPDTDEPEVDVALAAVAAEYSGNVMDNDKKGADDAKVTGASNAGGSQSADIDGDTTIVGALGLLVLHANGQWEYKPDEGTAGGDDVFTYTLTDGDGDQATATLTINVQPTIVYDLAAAAVGPTHTPADHYDREVTVTGLNGIVLDNKSTHFEDPTGGHVISGGGGNDFIEVTGNNGSPSIFGVALATNGNGGDDIIHGGGGKDFLRGGAGDDTIYGGNNDDDLYGDSGHDAMDGGAGNDKIHVDADDLDGTNTLDGIHSIDGGDGYDTVDISSMKSFDSNQAMHLENVEALAMDGKAGSGGTTMSLSYDAAYGITQVGGLHALSITGDASGKGADTVSLVHGAGGETWSLVGSNVYEAGAGASKVTVTVEAGVHVELS